MVPDLSQQPHNTPLNTDQADCRSEKLLLPSLNMNVLEFSHPFEEDTANNKSDVDTNDANEEFHALGLVNLIEYAHF
jgi:hypothetical protein